MTQKIFYLIAVFVGLLFGRMVSANEPMQMTMTLKPDGEVILIMAGTGTVTIDWGEKSPSETHTLLVYDKDDWQNDWQKYSYRHVYSRKSARTITITGANITHLECNRLGLKSLDVSKNNSLTSLNCAGNQLIRLDVSNNTMLTELKGSYNRLTSLDVSKNIILTNLDCSGNKLISLDVTSNPALTELNCLNTHLTSLDVSNNTALTVLDCDNNQLMCLDISNNTALTHLNCSNNQLTSLDVSKNTALTTLHCSENQLMSMDVTKNIALEELHCFTNQIIDLEMSRNTKLTLLNCSKNQLTSLNVGSNTELLFLNCGNNQLTNLNVSNNTELTDLLCYGNQLANLDLSKNTKLIYLGCHKNQLTKLYVGNNVVLAGLDCFDNQLTTTALNALFETLHSDTISIGKKICVRNNQGENTCDQSIATHKGWVMICPAWSVNVWREKDTTIIKNTTFDIVHDMPLFNGKSAEEGFREYVSRKTVYPWIAQLNGIEGTVVVEFTIDQKGKLVEAIVVQSVHPLLDTAALRVTRSSPKWTPGMQRGKKVKVRYTFPVNFRLR